jgi:hypothetical protein
MRAAVLEANRMLGPEDQIAAGAVAYTVHHAVITDLLSEDELDPAAVEEITGASYEMIKRNYYKSCVSASSRSSQETSTPHGCTRPNGHRGFRQWEMA